MVDEIRDIAHRGIARLENELLVRDFLEVAGAGDSTALAPFFHREVRYRVGMEPEVVGSRAVISFCARFAAAFPEFDTRVEAMSSVDDTVLVEESVRIALDSGCECPRVVAFASFRIRDYQIVSWRQIFG